MTAPDVNADVRARFERDYMLRYPNAQGWMFDRDAIGNYMHEPTHLQWLGYRAAHTDMAGEVRELVEALDGVRQYGSDTLSGNAEGPTDRDWFRDGVREMTRRARTALAKFTHQEKPRRG